MITNISQSAGGSLQELLRSKQKGQEEQLEAPAPETLAAQALGNIGNQSVSERATSSNLMSRNFASAEREESKYVKASLTSLKVSKQINDQQQNALTSILDTAIVECQNAGSLGETYKAIKRAEKKLMWNQGDEIRKTAEKTHLKESKEAIEDKAQEATAPTDANGNPIEGLPTESAGEGESMPEISGSNPAPAPEAAPTPAPEVAAAPTPEIAVASTPAPSTPSIDITV